MAPAAGVWPWCGGAPLGGAAVDERCGSVPASVMLRGVGLVGRGQGVPEAAAVLGMVPGSLCIPPKGVCRGRGGRCVFILRVSQPFKI